MSLWTVLHLYVEQDEFLQDYTPVRKGALYPKTNVYKTLFPCDSSMKLRNLAKIPIKSHQLQLL